MFGAPGVPPRAPFLSVNSASLYCVRMKSDGRRKGSDVTEYWFIDSKLRMHERGGQAEPLEPAPDGWPLTSAPRFT